MPARSLALAALAALCLTATAAASLDAGSSLRFGFVPKKAFQGQPASMTVVVRPTGVRCSPVIRYADNSAQRLKPAVARAGRASWKWTVPAKVRLGAASASVSCGKAGRVARSFAVVGPPTAPAQVNVRKSGFSQRVRFTGRDVSYGVVLHNPSPENDALGVVVLVNFVDATNRVVDTDTETIATVSAGSEYYLGGSTSIPDASQVSSLEVVVRIGGQTPKRKVSPAISDVLVQQARYDPGWVGAVVGQLENDSTTMLLSSTQDLGGRLRLVRERHRRGSGKDERRTAPRCPGLLQRRLRSRLDPVRPCGFRQRLGAREVRSHELAAGAHNRQIGRTASLDRGHSIGVARR